MEQKVEVNLQIHGKKFCGLKGDFESLGRKTSGTTGFWQVEVLVHILRMNELKIANEHWLGYLCSFIINFKSPGSPSICGSPKINTMKSIDTSSDIQSQSRYLVH